MSTLTLTLPVGFANGVGNVMDAAHLATPLGQIEAWLQGQLGRDGVPGGTDNFAGDEKVRGLNFQKNGLTEAFTRKEFGPWVVAPDIYATGRGMNPSPLPGSALRFYLRANAVALWIVFTARRGAVGGASDLFTHQCYLDTTALASHQSTPGGAGASRDAQIRVVSGTATTALILKGWHEIRHTITGSGVAWNEHQSDSHELVVVAAYK